MFTHFFRKRRSAIRGFERIHEALESRVHGVELAFDVVDARVAGRRSRRAEGTGRIEIPFLETGLPGIIGTIVVLTEAVGAVDRLLAVRTERHLATLVAVIAFGIVEFAWSVVALTETSFIERTTRAVEVVFLKVGHKASYLRLSCKSVSTDAE